MQASTGETFLVQLLDDRPHTGGGHISTVFDPRVEATFTVDHAFGGDYLILSDKFAWYLATPVTPAA
jgi:hypothetical protein